MLPQAVSSRLAFVVKTVARLFLHQTLTFTTLFHDNKS